MEYDRQTTSLIILKRQIYAVACTVEKFEKGWDQSTFASAKVFRRTWLVLLI